MGLHSHGEKVHINFGREPFVFDIAAYIRALADGREVPMLVKPAPKTVKDKEDETETEPDTEQPGKEKEKGGEPENENEEPAKREATRKAPFDMEGDVFVEEKLEPSVEDQERDWEEERDISPLERIMQRIDEPGAEQDADFIEYVRVMLRHECVVPFFIHVLY